MIEALDLVLTDRESGREVARAPLPAHTRERLAAAAALDAVLERVFEPDGSAVELRHFGRDGGGGGCAMAVELAACGRSYRRVFGRESLADDAQVIAARARAAQAIAPEGQAMPRAGQPTPRAVYALRLAARAEAGEPPACGVRLQAAPRRLVRLLALDEAAVGPGARRDCDHALVQIPRRIACGLLARARATPDVEIGAALVVASALLRGRTRARLVIRVVDAVPLERGTRGDAVELRISPDALAAVPVDREANRWRGGLAHSHPSDGVEPALFLSAQDLAMATGFFHRPWQIEIVVDPSRASEAQALGVFAWCGGRLLRVCFELLGEEAGEGATWAS